MVGAGRVAADPYSAYECPLAGIQSQTSAEHVDSTNSLANHGVIVGAHQVRVATIGHDGIDGITVLQTKKGCPQAVPRKRGSRWTAQTRED